MADAIFYGEENNNIFIRALGRVTVNICHRLRERVFTRLSNLPTINNIFVDLSRCDYMDSTFMGIILGINKKLKKISDLGVTVVCPSDECGNLFLGLNVLQFFTIMESLIDFPEHMETISVFERPNPEVVLLAHDDLMEVSEANADKFRVLRSILQKRVIEERKKEAEKYFESEETLDDLASPDNPLIVFSAEEPEEPAFSTEEITPVEANDFDDKAIPIDLDQLLADPGEDDF